jgi:hypothetical protein
LCVLSAALSALSVLAVLSVRGLTVPAELSRLVVLLALTWLAAGILAAERFNLATKPFEPVQRRFRALGSLSLTTGDERLLGLMQVIAQSLQTGGDLCLGPVRVGIEAAAKPVGRTLEPCFEIGLVDAFERAAELVGGGSLSGVELARGVAHALLELRQVVGHSLTIGGKLLDVPSGGLSGAGAALL